MARYTGPKHKLCRRLGHCVWGNAKCPSNKRPFPPGQHGPTLRRKMSVYGQQLLDKQVIRAHYGLMERQMRKTFKEAQRMGGVTGTNLLMLLECRLDTIVHRMGYAPSICAARQLVNHGHIEVNGKKVDIPSYSCKAGMVISIREGSRKIPMIAEGAESPPVMIPEYIDRAPKAFTGKMTALPNSETLPWKVDTAGVIGFYSR